MSYWKDAPVCCPPGALAQVIAALGARGTLLAAALATIALGLVTAVVLARARATARKPGTTRKPGTSRKPSTSG